MYNIIFVGAPGAGKGTQAIKVAEALGVVQVASGDIFRQNIEQNTPLGELVKAYMAKGELVPDYLTIEMVLQRLAQPDAVNGVILDGFPRNLHQAEELDRALGKRGQSVDKTVYLNVDEEELIKRLSSRRVCRVCQAVHQTQDSACTRCGGELYQRADDTEETVKRRLEVFFVSTAPLVEYYRLQNKLVIIDGLGDVDEIMHKIIDAIKK